MRFVTTEIKTLRTPLALAAAFLAIGCSGADDFNEGEPKIEGEAVYALTSNVWGTDGAMGYLYTASSLSEGAPGLEPAIEFPGGAWLTGRDGGRYVYVSSGAGGATITRCEVLENGELVEDKDHPLSFVHRGLKMGIRFGTAPILSET